MAHNNTTVEDLMKEYDLTDDDVKLLIERHIVDKKFEEDLYFNTNPDDFDSWSEGDMV